MGKVGGSPASWLLQYVSDCSQCVYFQCERAFMCLSSVGCTCNTRDPWSGSVATDLLVVARGQLTHRDSRRHMQSGPWMPEPTLTRLQAIGSNVILCSVDLHIRTTQAQDNFIWLRDRAELFQCNSILCSNTKNHLLQTT